jgi:transposase
VRGFGPRRRPIEEEEPTVVNATRWVGLDVHASQTACAMFDAATGEVATRRVMGRPHEVIDWLLALQAPVRAVYEAGPTGYGLARRGRAAGIDVQVCAPGMITRSATERIKTDKRDALKLARLFAAGQLVLVHVPTLEHEQLRDLARCREDVRQDLMRAKHRIGKFLLRREIYYPGRGRAWTREHRTWLASLRFADSASELTFADYLHAHDVLAARRDRLDQAIYEQAGDCSWAPIIARLRCLHGIDALGAFGLCAEVCDFQRFPKAVALSAYLGLVPSENTSGDKRRLGSITKAGSTLARRLLVEAAYHYRRPPRVGGGLLRRQDGAEPWVIDLSWRAQRRLHGRWQRLRAQRGKPNGIAAIAVARELAHFCWELAITD